MKKLLSYLQLIRPINFLITFAVIIVAAIISTEGNYSSINIILAALSGALAASAGNIINDYFDINIDKINHPKRPLPAGKLSSKNALTAYFIFTLSSIIISLFINRAAFITLLISHLILFYYSYKLKRIPLAGNITVALMTAIAFIYGGIAVENVTYTIIPALFAFLINLIREFVKDMEDVEGDMKEGVITFPSKYGTDAAKKIIMLLSLFLILLTIYPFIYNYYKIEYFILVMVIVNPILVYVIKSLFDDDSLINLNKISFILKLNMIFGLIAIYFGK